MEFSTALDIMFDLQRQAPGMHWTVAADGETLVISIPVGHETANTFLAGRKMFEPM